MKVLLVDDNATDRKLLADVLQGEGLSTIEAADGLEALAVLKTQIVQAIISDILMPKMDGYRFCIEVRRQPPLRETPFIFYSTADTSVADERLALHLGANKFLHKPAPKKTMTAALGELLSVTPRPACARMELAQELELMKEYSQYLAAKLNEKNTELLQRTGELLTLSGRLLEAQETARRRLARELHDEVGQALSVIKLNLEGFERPAGSGAPGGNISETILIVDQLLQQVRGMSLNLRPSILDDLGLVAALRWYIRQQGKRAGPVATFTCAEEERRYDPAVETACFRVAQEAMTNVVRHARAQHVTLSLREADGALHLVVRDDGTGFDVPTARRHAQHGGSFGLIGMQERVLLVGGQLEFESNPSRGTELRARFPLAMAATTKLAPHDAKP